MRAPALYSLKWDKEFDQSDHFSKRFERFLMTSVPPLHGRELRGKDVRIRSSEYLVYHFRAKDGVRCTPSGEMLNGFNEVGYVFDDLSWVRQYCQEKIEQAPKLGCVVYGQQWKVVEQFTNPQYMAQIKRTQSPQRRLVRGLVFLAIGSFLIWLEDRHGWSLIVGFLVGARFAVGGIVHITLSIMNWGKESVE
jgi:hypothetical protein